MRVAVLVLTAGLLTGSAATAEVVSGLEVGAPTQSIPVFDVTGDYAGKRICYVCEFQDDPNVLAFFRDTGESTRQLILELDALYRERADAGFKAVAMIVAGREAQAWLSELNEAEDIAIPLTVFYRGPSDVAARLYAINPEVDNTFLVTRNRFVVANVSDIAATEFERVVADTDAMIAATD
jgi:hypothetical protein